MQLSVNLSITGTVTLLDPLPLPDAGWTTFVNPEAAAVVAAMDVQPDDTRKELIDNLVGSLKAGGVWAKLTGLCVAAAHDQQTALLDWITPSLPNFSWAGSLPPPAFTPDRGLLGSSSSYMGGGTVQQDDAHVGCYVIEANSSTALDVNAPLVSSLRIADTPSWRINTSSASVAESTAPNRHYMVVSRPDAETMSMYLDGAAGVSSAATSTGTGVLGWARNSTRTAAIYHIGKALTQSEANAAYAAFRTYLQAIGTGVP